MTRKIFTFDPQRCAYGTSRAGPNRMYGATGALPPQCQRRDLDRARPRRAPAPYQPPGGTLPREPSMPSKRGRVWFEDLVRDLVALVCIPCSPNANQGPRARNGRVRARGEGGGLAGGDVWAQRLLVPRSRPLCEIRVGARSWYEPKAGVCPPSQRERPPHTQSAQRVVESGSNGAWVRVFC